MRAPALCGLQSCDCDYTIDMLLEALESLTPPNWSLNDPMRRKYALAREVILKVRKEK